MGGRLLRAWLLRPLVALERDPAIASTPSRSSPFATTERGKLRDTLQGGPRPRAARRARGARHRRPARSGRRCASRSPSIPRVRTAARAELQAPLVEQPGRRARRPRRRPRRASSATLVDEPPALARDGGFIRDGVDPELDELRDDQPLRQAGASPRWKRRERARTGISSLKIRYNRVFGYYIEISKSNLHAVPADYHRKQTIAGGERFITPALKDYEEKVLGADERILERELELFEALRAAVAAEAPRVQDTARALAALDVLAALGRGGRASATTPSRTCTTATSSRVVDARHPVVERLRRATPFVPNDVTLERHDAAAGHPHRPEHGRQVDLPAADGAALR